MSLELPVVNFRSWEPGQLGFLCLPRVDPELVPQGSSGGRALSWWLSQGPAPGADPRRPGREGGPAQDWVEASLGTAVWPEPWLIIRALRSNTAIPSAEKPNMIPSDLSQLPASQETWWLL